MEILIIFILILLNGIFSMSEIALVSSKKVRLENAAKKGSKQALEALKLMNNPGKFLSTVQIGITLIGLLTGIYSGDNLTEKLQVKLDSITLIAPYSKTLSITIVLILLTYFSLILGELVPKRIGMSNPEHISRLMAQPMKIISIIAAPFVWLLSFSTELIMKLIPGKKQSEDAFIEEEIKAIVQEGTHKGEVQEIEQEIVSRVFSLGDRKVSSLMTHRVDLIKINLSESNEEIIEKIKMNMHSIYPVFDENDKNLLGIVKLKDIIFEIQDHTFKITNYITKPYFVHENSSAYDVLDYFKKEKISHTLVTNEFGHIEGVLSLNDILEALAGNADEFDQSEPQIYARENGSWLIDGQYLFADFLHYFELEDYLSDYDFTTVGGLIIHELRNVPTVGTTIYWEGYKFEVVDMDGARIDKIHLEKL